MPSGPDHDDDDLAVTRSEERLHVTTRRTRVGRAILRRTVVVEERVVTVQVLHEEAHLEIVPFDPPVEATDQDAATHLALPDFVLHREEITVVRRVVPVERVRLQIAEIVEQQRIDEDLRHEVVDLDTASDPTS